MAIAGLTILFAHRKTVVPTKAANETAITATVFNVPLFGIACADPVEGAWYFSLVMLLLAPAASVTSVARCLRVICYSRLSGFPHEQSAE